MTLNTDQRRFRKERKALRTMHMEQYRKELKSRDRFFLRYPCWTRRQLREAIEHQGGKDFALIDKWIRSGKIFRVKHHGKEFFPAFQFDEGKRIPFFKTLLRTMRNDRSNWSIAHWLVSNNGWLIDSVSPLELILNDPEAVLDAAIQEILPLL